MINHIEVRDMQGVSDSCSLMLNLGSTRALRQVISLVINQEKLLDITKGLIYERSEILFSSFDPKRRTRYDKITENVF